MCQNKFQNLNIDPYELLGVNDNSTIEQLDKCYNKIYNLCCEENSGNKYDIEIIQSAYIFIKKKLKKKKKIKNKRKIACINEINNSNNKLYKFGINEDNIIETENKKNKLEDFIVSKKYNDIIDNCEIDKEFVIKDFNNIPDNISSSSNYFNYFKSFLNFF